MTDRFPFDRNGSKHRVTGRERSKGLIDSRKKTILEKVVRLEDLAEPDDPVRMNRLFTLLVPPILLILIAAVFTFLFSRSGYFDDPRRQVGFDKMLTLFQFIYQFAAISFLYSALKLLNVMWNQIPEDDTSISPAMRIGLFFIPVFNLYWLFVTHRGLALKLNRSLRQTYSDYVVPVRLVTATCVVIVLAAFLAVLYCYTDLPVFRHLCLPPLFTALILMPVMYGTLKRGATELYIHSRYAGEKDRGEGRL